MTIYKQMMRTYFRTPSTWILTILAIFATSILTIVLIEENNLSAITTNKSMIFLSFMMVIPFLLITIILFAAFKSVQLFRDDITSGILLSVISKPISRTKMFVAKWLALISIFFVFMLPVILIQIAILFHFIKFHSLRSDILIAGLTELGTTFFIFLLVSSLCLLISLRLGIKTILGFAIMIGGIALVGNSISLVGYHQAYKPIFQRGFDQNNNIDNNSDYGHYVDLKNNSTNLTFHKTPKYFIHTEEPKKPIFNKLWPFDFNYQFAQMATASLGSDFHTNAHDYQTSRQKPMKIKSSVPINTDVITNSVFMNNDDYQLTNSLTNYLKNHQANQKTLWNNLTPLTKTVNNFFAYALTHIQTTHKSEGYSEINLSLPTFKIWLNANKSTQSPQIFVDISQQLLPWYNTYLKNTNSNSDEILPPVDVNNISNYQANGLFNWFLSNNLSNSNLSNYNKINNQLFLIDQFGILHYNFNQGVAFPRYDTQWDYHNSSVLSLCDFSLIKPNKSNKQQSEIDDYYTSWKFSNSFYSELISALPFNGRDNMNQSDHEKFMSNLIHNPELLQKKIYHVTYENYANPFALYAFYITAGITTVLLSYWVFRKTDFN